MPSEEALQTWRRKGPVGKLHNLVRHIQKTPKRRRFFEMKQSVDPDSDDGRIYDIWRLKFFAIPASAAPNERTFSIVGNLVENDRPRTLYELAEAQQLLHSCYDTGLASDIVVPTWDAWVVSERSTTRPSVPMLEHCLGKHCKQTNE